MRIAIIAPPWVQIPPPAYGGIEAVLDSLARGLVTAGHDVLLYATGDSTCTVPTAWTLPQAAGTVGVGSATELRHVINAYETILDWEADVVHDHTLVGPVYAARFGVPVVTTNHGPFCSELGDFYRVIGGKVPIVAVSHHQASTANLTSIAAVIHHGLDVDTFPVGSGDGGYALFLGRMSPDKGVHVAARVARSAGVPLKIVAKMREPAEQAYFQEQVAPLLGHGIDYLGEVGGDQKLELIGAAACLLNPVSWPEPFGMVMIESLACGTPVVAFPNGSVPELIDDGVTGFVRDTEAGLIAAMGEVGDLRRSACRTAVVERFSTERMVAGHVVLYELMLARHRPLRVA